MARGQKSIANRLEDRGATPANAKAIAKTKKKSSRGAGDKRSSKPARKAK